jgi:hypothetical protein
MPNTKEGKIPPYTIMDLFERSVKESPKVKALFIERNGQWISWTWNHYHKEIVAFAGL